MIDEQKLLEITKGNRMDKSHETYGFPQGWNAAMEFVEQQIEKLKEKSNAAEVVS